MVFLFSSKSPAKQEKVGGFGYEIEVIFRRIFATFCFIIQNTTLVFPTIVVGERRVAYVMGTGYIQTEL